MCSLSLGFVVSLVLAWLCISIARGYGLVVLFWCVCFAYAHHGVAWLHRNNDFSFAYVM